MKYQARYIFLLLADAILINLAFYVMLLLRFDPVIPIEYKTAFFSLIPLITIISILFLVGMRLYTRVWEYASIGELLAIVRATTFSMAFILMAIYLFKLPTLPRSVYIGSWVFMNIFIGASRVWWRVFRDLYMKAGSSDFQKVLIVGAGDAGALLVKEIQNNPHLKRQAVGMVDDDLHKQHMMLSGVPIVGTRKNIENAVRDLEIDEIIIAMPSVPGSIIRDTVDICKRAPARVRILPGIYESTNGSLIRNIRDVQMEDLLRREPVTTNLTDISGYINDKCILVTGAGGSIGSELCRQVAKFSPRELILLDCCENNLFDIDMELRQDYPETPFFPELVDVRNEKRLEKVFKSYHPQVIFHAAAFKHVPMMELHPDEAINNNVVGTLYVSKLADRYGAEIFIYISTDKAVNPTSVMGASKRIAELLIKDLNQNSSTRFASVRFGNVLGSRGSVIPTFMKQIEKGGPVTVTHPEMRRYFMTIPEAVQLVIQAGSMAEGGEIFVLDMGEMVSIDDLARDLIQLSGYEPDKDIQIIYTGIRSGEKLYEELFSTREQMAATRHDRIFISEQENQVPTSIFDTIESVIVQDTFITNSATELISEILPDFRRKKANINETSNFVKIKMLA
ncbi:MAG TPA: nucleoside-diphosphate sugar epimerase/dehydratase [Syntrophomonadaceae bacterium]|nr:nucleoside-diphosphate sugar epimerase/dehydratase [Syntrophomonadaceae bacterium]